MGSEMCIRDSFVTVTALGIFELARRQFLQQWSAIQTDIEKEIKRRETQ